MIINAIKGYEWRVLKQEVITTAEERDFETALSNLFSLVEISKKLRFVFKKPENQMNAEGSVNPYPLCQSFHDLVNDPQYLEKRPESHMSNKGSPTQVPDNVSPLVTKECLVCKK